MVDDVCGDIPNDSARAIHINLNDTERQRRQMRCRRGAQSGRPGQQHIICYCTTAVQDAGVEGASPSRLGLVLSARQRSATFPHSCRLPHRDAFSSSPDQSVFQEDRDEHAPCQRSGPPLYSGAAKCREAVVPRLDMTSPQVHAPTLVESAGRICAVRRALVPDSNQLCLLLAHATAHV